MSSRKARSPLSPMSRRLPQKGMPVIIEADARQRARLASRARAAFGRDLSRRASGGALEAQRRQGQRPCRGRYHPGLHRHPRSGRGAYRRTGRGAASAGENRSSGAQGFEGGGEIILDAEGPDSPETFSGDTIDVGALAEQFFGLAIDPYPRKAGRRDRGRRRRTAGRKRIPEKAAFAARKILKTVRILEKLVVRRRQNSYFRQTFASPLILAGLRR